MDRTPAPNSFERLIIFTRYPQAGTTKTRLIPALGPQGAADLHRQMAQRMVSVARQISRLRGLAIGIEFTGAKQASMADWLGRDLSYRRQTDGDLGRRMHAALSRALDPPARRAVLIGTDIPEITAGILNRAFDHLGSHEMVLGPTRDGGYYLIGLAAASVFRALPAIFEGIAWSTDTVFAETRRRARRMGLGPAVLPVLSDVDRPEDLAVWDKCCRRVAREKLP